MAALDDQTTPPKKILVVDDEAPILDAVSYALRKEGFKVVIAMNAEACMRAFKEEKPDLIVLDVMLPSASGFEVCQRIRSTSSTPVILLTAKAEERDRLHGLDIGADDYVTKPFSVRELTARIRAVLRRKESDQPSVERIQVGDLVIEEARHEAHLGEKLLELSPKEFALLSFLARHTGLVFSRQALLDRVWGEDAYVDERTIDVHVSWIRSKIETNPSKPERLLTVRGVGYKYAGKA